MSGKELLHAIDKWLDQGEALWRDATDAECGDTADIIEDAVKSLNNNWQAIRKEVLRNV